MLLGSKDNGLLQHDTETGQKVRTLLPRWPKPANAAVEEARSRRRGESSRSDDIAARQAREAEVLCVAASSDGRLLASGGSDRLIHVWDTRQGTLVHSLQGHGGDVLALAFRDALGFEDDEDDDEEDNDREQQLFSASADRNVKHWQAEAGSYVETVFGHSSAVSALDCGFDERPVSGGRDRCARVWKIRDETHLVFRAPHDAGLGGSVDAVRVIDRDRFVSGGDDGGLSLWSTRRKKPVVTIKRAHGSGAVQKIGEDVPGPIPRWVSAAAPRGARTWLFLDPATASCGSGPSARATTRREPDARGAIPQPASSTIWHVRRPARSSPRPWARSRGSGAGGVPRRRAPWCSCPSPPGLLVRVLRFGTGDKIRRPARGGASGTPGAPARRRRLVARAWVS